MKTLNAVLWLAAATAVMAGATAGLRAQPAAPAPGSKEPPVYRPVMSDLMNSVIQPRHIKLSLAGQQGDWEYAEYERHNIGGAMGRIATAIPSYKGLPTKALVAGFVTPQLAALDGAIKARDLAAFTAAYGALTAGCNQCHATTNHRFVVIKAPDATAFPDQDFTAPHG